jgi:hypothetical protein
MERERERVKEKKGRLLGAHKSNYDKQKKRPALRPAAHPYGHARLSLTAARAWTRHTRAQHPGPGTGPAREPLHLFEKHGREKKLERARDPSCVPKWPASRARPAAGPWTGSFCSALASGRPARKSRMVRVCECVRVWRVSGGGGGPPSPPLAARAKQPTDSAARRFFFVRRRRASCVSARGAHGQARPPSACRWPWPRHVLTQGAAGRVAVAVRGANDAQEPQPPTPFCLHSISLGVCGPSGAHASVAAFPLHPSMRAAWFDRPRQDVSVGRHSECALSAHA